MIHYIRMKSFVLVCAALFVGAESANAQVPPTITKQFLASSIVLNTGKTTLTFTITNPNTAVGEDLTQIGFTDTLPSGLVIATPNGQTGSCPSGTITANSGTNVISLSGAALPAQNPPDFCTFSVDVAGIAAGHKINTTGTVTAFETGNLGGTATDMIDVVAPPVVTHSFSPGKIPLNANSTVTFNISSPAANSVSLTGIAIVDSLPPGILVASPNGLVGGCGGGSISAVAAMGLIALQSATLAPGASCSFQVDVTGTQAGVLQSNVLVTSSNGGPGVTSTAVLIVVGPPTVAKKFTPNGIPLNGSTTVTFTISNTNNSSAQNLTGIGFTDTLPAGLIIATPSNLASTCATGTPTANGGTNSIGFSGGALAAASQCTFSVSLTGIATGVQNNTTSSISSAEGGPGPPAMATMSVLVPPTLTKAFGVPGIPLNGSTTLSFVVTNPNTDAATGVLTGVSLTDNLPAGLVVSTLNGLSGACGGGTITAMPGSSVVSLTGATLAANGSCTFSINVTGMTPGKKINSTSPGSTNGGGGTPSPPVSLLVFTPPTITKSFSPGSLPLNTVSTLTFTISNPNTDPAATLNGIGFTDTMPAGIVVSISNNLSNLCGGSATANPGSNSISLSGASLAPTSTCTLAVSVTGIGAGNQLNNTGPVHSNEGGDGPSSPATLTVVAPPLISKTFGATSVLLNGTTSLSFTITNPAANTVPLTGVGFLDTLPSGLIVATPNGLTGACGGGTISAAAGSGLISLTGATLPVGGTCTFSVNVTGTTLGTKNNSVTPTSIEGGTGSPATAQLIVTPPPPTITKSFDKSSIPPGGTATLTFVIANPATDPAGTLTGVNFTDTLPSGLVVSTPNGVTGSCPSGTISAAAGTQVIGLSGATLAPNTACSFAVNVTGTAPGNQINTTSPIHSTQAADGTPATASILVVAPPVITKTFNPTTLTLGGTSILTFTIANPLANVVSLTGVGFSDGLPFGLVISSVVSGSCGGGTIAAPLGLGNISLTGATLPTNGTCTFSVGVTATVSGSILNTVTVASANGGIGNTAQATLFVGQPSGGPTIAKLFASPTVLPGGTVALTFTITNPNAVGSIAGIAFTDALPPGLTVASPNGLNNTCGGTAIATPGSSSISLSGVTLAASTSCTLTVNITADPAIVPPVRICNTTSTINSNQGQPGAPASACITVGDTAIIPTDAFQIRYAANLNVGDSFVNLSNTGALNGTDPAGNLCTGVYTFDPSGEMISCCSCLVTPNGLKSLSAQGDLIANTLTGNKPTSIVIKLVATFPSAGACAPTAANLQNLASGIVAWGTTLHSTTGSLFGNTETEFATADLSLSELAKLNQLCALIVGNGSGPGICGTCRLGALGAEKKF